MKPLNREEVLHKEGNGTPSNKSVIHKPSKKAKEEIFGGGKPTIYGKKKSPRKVKKDKKNKKKVAGLPLGAKIGAGVAGVAVVGGSVAALVHNMGGTKNDVQNANRHSKDTGLDFGTDKDDNDKSDLESHKSSRKKNDAKHNKHEKKSKGEDALDDLLGGDSDSSSDDSSSKSSKSKHSGDSDDTIESLINGMSGGNSSSDKGLKALAEKATKSVSQANKLGGKEASKAVKGKSEPSKLPNAKENKDEKTNKDGLTSLAYKPGQKQDDQLDAKINDLVARTNTQRENNGKGRVTENVNNGGNKGNTGTATARTNNNGNTGSSKPTNTGKPSNPLHNNPGDVVVKPDNPSHETKPNNPGHQTNPDNPGHETKPDNPGHETKPDNPGHETNPDNPTTPTYPYQSVPDGTSKTVTFVDASGKQIGTGTLTKNGNNVSVNGIPSGYKLSDLDTEGHSPQLLQWPNSISVVSDGTTPTEPGHETKPDNPVTPTYPYQSVPDGTSKTVTFVDASGKQVGTGTLTKNGNNVSLSDIPGGYKLADLDTEGHSAQLLQWPDTINVVSDGTSQPSTPTYPFQNVADGTTKEVTFVDADGKQVGTGTLTKNGNNVSLSDIPSGYKLADEDAEGHSAQLLQWPDTINVVSDGTNQPSTPTYPFQNVADGTTKRVTFVDADGKQVGTGTLTKNGNNVSVDGIPGGYKLSDLDTEGHSTQLLQWPDTISVVSDGTSQPSKPDNPTYPAQSIPDGTSKRVQFVTSDGTVIGTGTLSKVGNSVQISDIPGGYKLSDLDTEGHSVQLLQWPDTISVISDGTSQPSKPDNPNTPTYPAQDVADGTTKEVTFVDTNGNQVGTGTLTKSGNSISVDGIPGGYKLSDLDSNGHSAQLLQWPNSITVISDGPSVQPGGNTNPDQPSNPTYPFQSVPDGTSKTVVFVDASGNQVGTGTLTKNGNSVHLSGIPGGYKLSDEDSQGHSAQLYQWPNSITVVSDGSSVQPGGNANPDQPSNPTYPAQSIPDGTSKQVQFVTSDGTVVGTGTLTKRNGGVAVDGIPGDYQMTDLDSQGHSMQLWNWPDKITVISVNSFDVAKYIHA